MQTSSSSSAVQSSISEVGALCLIIARISLISMSNNGSYTILSARNNLTQEQLNGELTHHHRRSSDPQCLQVFVLYSYLFKIRLLIEFRFGYFSWLVLIYLIGLDSILIKVLI